MCISIAEVDADPKEAREVLGSSLVELAGWDRRQVSGQPAASTQPSSALPITNHQGMVTKSNLEKFTAQDCHAVYKSAEPASHMIYPHQLRNIILPPLSSIMQLSLPPLLYFTEAEWL